MSPPGTGCRSTTPWPALRAVDFLIDGLRKGGADRERAHETLFGLGAYVGEVLVRRAGAVWVDLGDH